MAEKNLNSRIIHKHDTEANWSSTINFVPKIGEIIVYDPDENHAAARVKIGDGIKTVIELAFIDDAAKEVLFKEIDMVDEKVEALGLLVGDASIPEQIEEALLKTQADWKVNDETSAAYIKNRTHWEEELAPITIFEEQEVKLVTDRYVAMSNHLGFVLKPNTKYRAIFDGKEYEGVSYYKDEYKKNIYLFNKLYQNDNLNDVFCVDTYLGTEPTTYLEVRAKDEGTHTFALYELTTNVHQLDPKFIPTASEEQLIQLLMDIDALPAMTDSNGAIFTHKDQILLI